MLILGRTLQFLFMIITLMAAPMCAQAQQQRVEVQLSSNRISIDESVVLNVRAFSIDADLDASALAKNFDVTKRSSTRQIAIENGKRTSVVEWVLELVPKRTGVLEVEPVIVGTEQSRPVTLLVEEPASGANRDLFVEASVDVSEPYVQAQVIYTYRVFQDVRMLNASLSLPDVDGALMQQLGEERNYQEEVDGRAYTVSEIRYSIVPQRSGKIEIPSVLLKAVVPVNRDQIPNTRTRTRTLSRRTDSVGLNVKPRPAGLDGGWWLPAKEVKLQSDWSTPLNALVVGQPLTRTIHLMAQGVAETQLPQLEVPEVENVSIYADSPSGATNASENGLLSQQTNTWAVIPQVPGELVLPEVRVNWFDTNTGEARVAVLPEETLFVTAPADTTTGTMTASENQGSSNSESNAVPATDPVVDQSAVANDTDALVEQIVSEIATPRDDPSNNNVTDEMANAVAGLPSVVSNRWRNTAIALLAGWLLSLLGIGYWWHKKSRFAHQRTAANASAGESEFDRFRRRAGSKASLEPVKVACDSGDVSKIAQQVLAWSAMVWPDKPPTHISEIAKRLQHQPLTDLFAALDAAQYRSEGSVNPVAVESIPSELKAAIEQYQEPKDTRANSHALPAL